MRAHVLQHAAIDQFESEFRTSRSRLDRFVDGLNRLPRPAMAFGVLVLFIAVMLDPIWFADRMAGLSLVPEPLWWLLGAIVSFYFGSRHQSKSFEIRADEMRSSAKAIGNTMYHDKQRSIANLRENAAVLEWRKLT